MRIKIPHELKVKKISALIRWQTSDVKAALDLLPICTANTPKQAKMKWENADYGSDERAAAFSKWQELILSKVKKQKL